jgi:DNA replication protein DnaC
VAKARARSLDSVIPKRFRGMSLDRPPVAHLPDPVKFVARRFLEELGDNLAAGRGLWFFGDVGTGKTSVAMMISERALAAGHTVAVYSMPDLLRQLRATYADDASMHDFELLDRLAEVDLLHLDDLGAERMTPWVMESLYSLVNMRYEAEKSIVLTTNVSEMDDLASQIGQRTTSRLVEMCLQVPLYGSDQRVPA